MSAIDELILQMDSENSDFAENVKHEQQKLAAAVALMELREESGLSQRQFAEKVGKPQSTISRIENGNMNVSFQVLGEIGERMGKTLELKFV
jgi:DNA-binding XRE family transcriptional regulator